jgi:hypothetical protein
MKNWEFWKNHEGQPKTWERIGKYVENAWEWQKNAGESWVDGWWTEWPWSIMVFLRQYMEEWGVHKYTNTPDTQD